MGIFALPTADLLGDPMKTKLTLTMDRDLLASARRMMKRKGRSISAEVDALLERIANDTEPERKGWVELFGDLTIPIDMKEAESDSRYGKQLRMTAAYRQSKAIKRKRSGL